MNLIPTHEKIHRKHALRTIVAARPNVLCGHDFTKIYIDNVAWVYLRAYVLPSQGR